MAKIEKLQEVRLDTLRPYKKNAKIHDAEQVEKIAQSIKEFGFISPIIIDKNKNIIAGHGRVQASKLLNLETIPAVYIEGLTEEQKRAYILADNRLTELGAWDMATVNAELQELKNLDFEINLTGFDLQLEIGRADWFENRERFDTSAEGQDDEYAEFLEKFEQKKTTDDCYTPDVIYDAVVGWVEKEYNLKRSDFVRPFYPGGDYQKENYKPGAVVVDNPPFSILTEIIKYYQSKDIKFFLFCPTVSAFTQIEGVCSICVLTAVTYENGANVNTSFMTNLEPGIKARTAPALNEAMGEANKIVNRMFHREIPHYEYPPEVVTSALLGKYLKYGIDWKIKDESCVMVGALDNQKDAGKSIYGRGLLLSDKVTEESKRASIQAEEEKKKRAGLKENQPTVWEISEREREIIRGLK